MPWQVWSINLWNKDLCFSLGNKLLQEANDAFTLFADAKTELNHWHRGLIKPDLHDDCKRLCSSSCAIIDWLFGDDLQKHVKDLTEVNPIDKKVTTNIGLSSRPFDARNSRNYRFSTSHGRGYCQAWRLKIQLPTHKPPEQTPTEDKAGEVKVENLDHVSDVEVEVSKTLKVSYDCIAGRLKHFSSQWLIVWLSIKLNSLLGSRSKGLSQGKPVFPLRSNTSFKTKLINCWKKEWSKKQLTVKGEYISTIFICPKKDGTYRLILNLKNLY